MWFILVKISDFIITLHACKFIPSDIIPYLIKISLDLPGGILYAINGPGYDGQHPFNVQGFTLDIKNGALLEMWNTPQVRCLNYGLVGFWQSAVDPTLHPLKKMKKNRFSHNHMENSINIWLQNYASIIWAQIRWTLNHNFLKERYS